MPYIFAWLKLAEKEKEMLIKQRNIILLVLVVMLPIFKAKAYARPLGDEEKVRLRGSIKAQSYADLTIDVMLMKQVETKPEAVKNAKEAALEETKRLRKESNDDTITLKSVGIALPDGSEFRLSKRRIRIGSGKIRIDTTIFANEEMTETNYESTTINSLFDTNVPSYQIDHKLKRAFINNLRWSGREVLRFGKVDEDILMDIVRLCNPESHAKASKNKDFSYKSISNVDGQVVDEIECVNIESSQVKYKISLDPNNWRI